MLKLNALAIVLALFAWPTLAWGMPEHPAATREKFERVAKELAFLSTGDFVYDRDPSYPHMPREDLDAYNKALRSVLRPGARVAFPRSYSVKEIAPLLEHDNAKVRTLAMAALYHTEQPAAIDHLARMLDDDAESFPQPQRLAVAFLPDRRDKIEIPMQRQTVGEVARKLLSAMLEPSHGGHRLDGDHRAKTLDQFWSARKDRQHWIGWFEFRMHRATQGTSPIPRDRQWMIHHIGAEIEQLPPIEREIYYLAIFGQRDRRHLRGENQLRYAARRLGPDRLLALVSGEAVIDDPDLPKYVGDIQRYVYAHADQLLRKQDAGAVLQIARKSKHIDAYIAAATLSPEQAVDILHKAFKAKQGEYEGSDRAQAMIAMWRLVGEAQEDFIVDWFFADRSPKMGRAPYRADLAAALLERFNPVDRQLLARLIRDKRLDQVDLPTHRLIVQGLNRNLLHPVVDPEEERNTSHPLGDLHFDGMIKRARKLHPKETEALLAQMAQWRRKLRASIPHWESP